jgi:hypothetical protein
MSFDDNHTSSASRLAFIASHQVRREWKAEFIIAAKIFSGQRRDR